MKNSDLILIGIKRNVIAIYRDTGEVFWSTKLPGMMGQTFVTLLSDERQVFALANGRLHCLDLATGRLLWSNELSGMGYGFGTIALPGGPSAPDSATVAAYHAAQQAAAANHGAGAP